MNRNQHMLTQRAALEVLIEKRDRHLDDLADTYGALAEHVTLRECCDDDCLEGRCTFDLEYRAAEREFDRLTDEAIQLARECVPVATIFALPQWIRERIGESVPHSYLSTVW